MKSFQFSLKRMQGFKEQVLDKEKNALLRLQKELNTIEQSIVDLQTFMVEKSRAFQKEELRGVSATDLMGHRFYLENCRNKLKLLEEERLEAEQAVERQRVVVVKASQEVTGLNKLEEKQLEAYKHLAAKENENQISEFLSMQITRRKRVAQ